MLQFVQNCILDDGNNELVKRLPKIVRNCEVEVNHVEPFICHLVVANG